MLRKIEPFKRLGREDRITVRGTSQTFPDSEYAAQHMLLACESALQAGGDRP